MILWCDRAHGPLENMRRDATLLAAADTTPDWTAVLRVFRFAPPGITLGRSQSPAHALDLERCRADGIEWAVRPTGGRAIFHAEEWTYSLAARIEDQRWGGRLGDAYAAAALVIVRSLVRLGVPADLAKGRSRLPPGDGLSCFASTARHEILLGSRKLVGSAQRRTSRALLQQGSVLLGSGHLRLADYLPLAPADRAAARARLDAAAANAGPFVGGDAPLERWAEALRAELPADTAFRTGAEGEALTLEIGPPYTSLPS